MKTVLIGDIHGHDSWKQIVEKEKDADKFIFVGDYFDSFTVPGLIQMQNFQDIIAFKESMQGIELIANPPQKVVMLTGNHDLSYCPEIGDNGTSGYQARMAPSIEQLIDKNRRHLQMAYQFDDFVITHAGVSSEWLDDTFGSDNWKVETIADQINELFQYQPQRVQYRSYKLYDTNNLRPARGYGDETFQGPLWISLS